MTQKLVLPFTVVMAWFSCWLRAAGPCSSRGSTSGKCVQNLVRFCKSCQRRGRCCGALDLQRSAFFQQANRDALPGLCHEASPVKVRCLAGCDTCWSCGPRRLNLENCLDSKPLNTGGDVRWQSSRVPGAKFANRTAL
mmetsp:Transcript_7100/g.21528  ORF Transcript_7100/g.21528 Transcript_7100/m.21528 type:complete len:138 (-) Transcript_7100:11-424(-)